MRSSPSIVGAVLFLAAAPSASAFAPSPRPGASYQSPPSSLLGAGGGGGDGERPWRACEKAVADDVARNAAGLPNDTLSNFDDMGDDFFNELIGNSEGLYGGRSYEPSGKISSDYSGGGLSDRRRIGAGREFREEGSRLRDMSYPLLLMVIAVITYGSVTDVPMVYYSMLL